MNRSLKVLLAHISDGEPSTFVMRDVEILKEKFSVALFRYRGDKDLPRLFRLILSHDVFVSWFAWSQAFWGNGFARLVGRGSVTIVGGFEVAGLPEIGYGSLLRPISRLQTSQALRTADVVLAVSQSIREAAADVSRRHDIRLVYHGFDDRSFPLGEKKEKIALTVGEVTKSNLLRKGILTFIKAASYLPQVEFIVAGRVRDEALSVLQDLPSNARLTGTLSRAELHSVMQSAKVYVQASAHEGFGCSLAEAMLCGSVPVVTDRGAIPEVVGDTGFYVPYSNPEATAKAIDKAMRTTDSAGLRARQRIVERFPLAERRDRLIQAVIDAAKGVSHD